MTDGDASSFAEAPAVPAAPFWRPFSIRDHEGRIRRRAPVGLWRFLGGFVRAFRQLSRGSKFVSVLVFLHSLMLLLVATAVALVVARSSLSGQGQGAASIDYMIKALVTMISFCLPLVTYVFVILAPWLDPAIATQVLRVGKCPACSYPLAAGHSDDGMSVMCTECGATWFPRPLPQPALPPPAPAVFRVPRPEWTAFSLRVNDDRNAVLPVLLPQTTAYPEPKPERRAVRLSRGRSISVVLGWAAVMFVIFPLLHSATHYLTRASLAFLSTSIALGPIPTTALESVAQFSVLMLLYGFCSVMFYRMLLVPRAFQIRLAAWRCAACGGPLGQRENDGCRVCQRCNAAWRLVSNEELKPSLPPA